MAHIVMRPNRVLMFVLAVATGFAIWMGCKTSKAIPAAPPVVNAPATGLKPGLNDARIAFWTARLFEEYHYRQRPLDAELSVKFFDGYIDSLDPRHENFLQTDLAEFDHFRTNLDAYTTGMHSTADLTPAFVIYQRYLERFQQHAAYVNQLLRQEKFKFNTDEKILLDRRHEPFPKDLAAAKSLWRQWLRHDYLMEKLSLEISETNGTFTVKPPAGGETNIVATLARHYRWGQRMMTNLDSDRVLQIYLNALAHAYDPHSDYFSAPHAQDFSIGMNLSLFGIGAKLSEDDGYCTIRELVAGGPAVKSKQLKNQDRILAVAQGNQPPVDVVDMELEKVVQRIRGAKGTEVRLTVSPADDRATRKVVTLIRDEIKLEDSEAKAKLVEMPGSHGGTNRIGIIDLPSFYAPIPDAAGNSGHSYCSADVAKLVRKLKQANVTGLIIDLRSNPGGSLEEAIKLTGLFIKDGPVVLARDPDGHVQVNADPNPSQLYDGPLVVLINRFSASASEIAAAALQDYGRALIVGDTSTHGKGTVQKLEPLRPFVWSATGSDTNDPGTVKITIRKFYRISGASTQFKGVTPDLVLPDVLNYSTQIGESALDNALPWDTIQPVHYDVLNLVQPYLTSLRTRSDARLATNRDFLYVKQDIQQFQKLQTDKSATLNEREAIKERQRIAAQNKAREAERAARKSGGVKTYEITIKNAGLPGLPAPLGATNEAASATDPAAKPDKPDSAPAVDPMLDETEHILDDYISLESQNGILTAK